MQDKDISIDSLKIKKSNLVKLLEMEKASKKTLDNQAKALGSRIDSLESKIDELSELILEKQKSLDSKQKPKTISNTDVSSGIKPRQKSEIVDLLSFILKLVNEDSVEAAKFEIENAIDQISKSDTKKDILVGKKNFEDCCDSAVSSLKDEPSILYLKKFTIPVEESEVEDEECEECEELENSEESEEGFSFEGDLSPESLELMNKAIKEYFTPDLLKRLKEHTLFDRDNRRREINPYFRRSIR